MTRRATLHLTTAALLVAVIAGCGSTSSTGTSATGTSATGTPKPVKSAKEVPSLSAYWTLKRLDLTGPLGSPGVNRQGLGAAKAAVRVGALFTTGAQGDHFCTASAVKSPEHDLILTAAHCVYDRKNGGLKRNIAFVPAFRRGQDPYGVWSPKSFIIDDRWKSSSDPDFDVAFIVLKPRDGKNIGDVLGANSITFNSSYSQVVRVTGYPQTADAPITCVDGTSEQSPTQLRFPCEGFPGGTSGSPWVVRPDVRHLTATIVGVIGGYEEGGSSPDVSYSPYFGAGIKALYERAIKA